MHQMHFSGGHAFLDLAFSARLANKSINTLPVGSLGEKLGSNIVMMKAIFNRTLLALVAVINWRPASVLKRYALISASALPDQNAGSKPLFEGRSVRRLSAISWKRGKF